MVKSEHLLKKLRVTAQKVGEKEIILSLVGAGLSFSAADKIVRGDYPSTFLRKKTVKILERAITVISEREKSHLSKSKRGVST